MMKWFKHQSTARNDEKIARLEDKAGLEGYGFYFKVLEIVAEVVDASDKHEVTFSLTRWGRQTNITSKKFLFLSQCCADVGLMSVQRVDDDITVKIPNLLKYRDNHTKNLQAASKQEKEEEKEKEREKEKESKVPENAPPTSEFLDAKRVTDYLAEKIIAHNPKAKSKPDSWIDDIQKAIRLDKRSPDDLIDIIDWIYTGDLFWASNILSGKKLREKYDQMNTQRLTRQKNHPPRGPQTAPPPEYVPPEKRGYGTGNIIESTAKRIS
jgi:hypothetical protein